MSQRGSSSPSSVRLTADTNTQLIYGNASPRTQFEPIAEGDSESSTMAESPLNATTALRNTAEDSPQILYAASSDDHPPTQQNSLPDPHTLEDSAPPASATLNRLNHTLFSASLDSLRMNALGFAVHSNDTNVSLARYTIDPVSSNQHLSTPLRTSTTNTLRRVSFDSTRTPPLQRGHSDPASLAACPNDVIGLVPSLNEPSRRPNLRSPSPRNFWPLTRSRSREDPFIPVNPYSFSHLPPGLTLHEDRPAVFAWWLRQWLQQLVLLFHFWLPSVYFSRVGRVFDYAELSKPELQRMIDLGGSAFLRDRDWNSTNMPASLTRFKEAWEELVDTMIHEWKTLNVVSALLLSAILTIFQTDGANEPVTRHAALISLACALWSLVFGCIYILRFQTMRSMKKACGWAQASQTTTASIAWNVWVFLAIPSVFLCWSLIAFVGSILAFVWTTGTTASPPAIEPSHAVGPRVGVSLVFAIGALYFVLVIRTFRTYAEPTSEVLQGERCPSETGASGGGVRQWMSSPRLNEIISTLEQDVELGMDVAGKEEDAKSEAHGEVEVASKDTSVSLAVHDGGKHVEPRRGRSPR